MIMFQDANIISLNETHLGHGDTLTPRMMGIQTDMLTVYCDCNNRGGGVALIVNKNRSIGPELTTAKTGPIHLSSLVEIAFVD